MAKRKSSDVPTATNEAKILIVRGQRVMLDEDLAALYGVTTKRLNEQVTRNKERFPDDFAFRLTNDELTDLRSQIATSSWGGRRYLPRVFTEHGAVMLASVLRTQVAVEVIVQVVRAFVRFREIIAARKELARRLALIERKLVEHDPKFETVFDAIRRLMEPPPPSDKPPIGFGSGEKKTICSSPCEPMLAPSRGVPSTVTPTTIPVRSLLPTTF